MKHLLFIHFLLLLGATYSLAQGGLKADYFNGTEFNQYVATNFVDNLDFYWSRTPPVKGLHPNKCSVRYTGRLKSPKTGVVTFSARVDDGVRVWIGEEQIINNWRLNDVGYSKGTVEMKADQFYDLKIEYFNALAEAELTLLWTLPNQEERSWWESWWYEDERVVIAAQYFAPPLEKEVEVIPEPKQEPLVKAKPKPQSTFTPQPKIVQQEPLTVPQELKVMPAIQQYIPKSVEFDRAKSEILPISFPELNKLAEFLTKNPTRKVRIEGHTDNIGDMDKNLDLSERRAFAVAAYLVKKGVNSKQLNAKGFGGSKPLVTSYDKKYHPENRRVVFIIE